jgi:hypothetical protein
VIGNADDGPRCTEVCPFPAEGRPQQVVVRAEFSAEEV